MTTAAQASASLSNLAMRASSGYLCWAANAAPTPWMESSTYLSSLVLWVVRLGSAGWLVFGIILGLFAKEQGGLVLNLGYGILSGVPFGMLAGIVGFLIFGGIGVIRNAILRWLLWKNDYLPRDLVGFLDSAASLILLQKVGGTYRFVHRFFLEYFATGVDGRGNDNDVF